MTNEYLVILAYLSFPTADLKDSCEVQIEVSQSDIDSTKIESTIVEELNSKQLPESVERHIRGRRNIVLGLQLLLDQFERRGWSVVGFVKNLHDECSMSWCVIFKKTQN